MRPPCFNIYQAFPEMITGGMLADAVAIIGGLNVIAGRARPLAMPKCTIDGAEVEVAPGTTVIQAALQMGIHIPHFCWHPDLAVDGNCRMCLVEVEKAPKLQIACNTVVTDGMVVHTESEKAAQAHRTTLEFLLVNHPIDCPVCDQAGECYLQDQYMDHGLHDSKVEAEEKVRKRKVVDLGPIMLDAERCVLCSRCLRFEREVTGTNSFEFVNRGDHTQIATFENRPIEHNYAGNLADVCPVGALLSHDFRFKMRVWFLEETPSVCPGCSTGCNITIDHRDGEVHRLRPRRNVEVNKSWMCDIGRQEYREIGARHARHGRPVPRGEHWEACGGSRPHWPTLAARIRDAGDASAFVATPQAHERGPLRVPHAGGRRGRAARLPRRQSAGQGARARGRRAPACRPQPEHAGLPRPAASAAPASTRSLAACAAGRDQGAGAAGAGAAAPARGGRRARARAVRRRDGDARGPGAGRPPTWCCRPRCGPRWTARFTNYQRRVQRIRRAVPPLGDAHAALADDGPRAPAPGRHLPRRVGARGVRAPRRPRCRTTPGLTYGARGRDRPRAEAPAAPAEARRMIPEAR